MWDGESLDMDSMEEDRNDLEALCEAIDGMDVISCEEIPGQL